MNILLTGANGFLGKIIQEVLKDNTIITLGRTKATVICDLANAVPDLPAVDLVIHAAGKAHIVPVTAKEKLSFFEVNVNGTKNLLDALTLRLPKAFVFISSVAVYGKEQGEQIDEESPLQAIDPYGKSKIEAEKLILDWCKTYLVTCTILRLPLLVGLNPPGNLGAMIKAICKGYYVSIYGGKAKKSMVLATDVAKLIPIVTPIGGIYNLTDGYHPNFSELSSVIAKQLNKKIPYNIPLWLAKFMAIFGDVLGSKAPINSNKLNKITSDLTFDDSKARKLLNWQPIRVLDFFKQE